MREEGRQWKWWRGNRQNMEEERGGQGRREGWNRREEGRLGERLEWGTGNEGGK